MCSVIDKTHTWQNTYMAFMDQPEGDMNSSFYGWENWGSQPKGKYSEYRGCESKSHCCSLHHGYFLCILEILLISDIDGHSNILSLLL